MINIRANIAEVWDHKVHKYKEYHSVSPRVGIGTLPTPLSPASVPLPPEPGRGDNRLRVRGWGSPTSDDLRKSLALCLLCGLIERWVLKLSLPPHCLIVPIKTEFLH